MADEALPFDALMEELGLAAKWQERGVAEGIAIGEAEGEARGEAEGIAIGEVRGEKNAWRKVLDLMKQGYTVEQLEQMAPGP
ncbi:MAG: hypothetical protein LBT00_07870 [Spirochaetaceae bacterium]|jgi:hypothetical protein|nr:hypothetical protein [Spirochaetaceae bacterium]